MSENLEKLFKNAMEQVSVEPPARIWERIDSHFVMKQRRLKRIYTYSGIAAAVILLLCITFVIPNQQDTLYSPTPIAAIKPIDNSQDENRILAFTSTPHSIPAVTRKRAMPGRLPLIRPRAGPRAPSVSALKAASPAVALRHAPAGAAPRGKALYSITFLNR